MKITHLILGKGQPITDGRTLRAMAKADHFKYPIDRGHPYVDNENRPRVFDYKGKRFSIEYFDGCFFPFVVMTGGAL